MVKLSQQLAQAEPQRISRTQRVIAQQQDYIPAQPTQEQLIDNEKKQLQDRIVTAQYRFDLAKRRLEDYRSGDMKNPSAERRYELEYDEMREVLEGLQAGMSKVEQGYVAGDIIDYTENKAAYEREKRERRDISRSEKQAREKELKEKEAAMKSIFGNAGVVTEYDAYGNVMTSKKVYENGKLVADIRFDKPELSYTTTPAKKVFVTPKETIEVAPDSFKISTTQEKVKSQEQLQLEANTYLTDFNKKINDLSLSKTPEKKTFWQKAYRELREIGGASYITNPYFTESEAKRLEDYSKDNFMARFLIPHSEIEKAFDATEQADYRAMKEIEAFNELGSVTEKAPEELKYYVQEGGLDILGKKGIKTVGKIDEFTKQMSFELYGKEFEQRMPVLAYTALELERENRNPLKDVIKEMPVGTMSYNPDTKEFYVKKTKIGEYRPLSTRQKFFYTAQIARQLLYTRAYSKIIGATFNVAKTGATSLYSSLGGGFKVGEVAIRGSNVYAELIPIKKVSETALGVVVKPAVYSKLLTGATYLGGAGLYGYGAYQRQKAYTEQFGKTGKELSTAFTIGEVGGVLTAIGESAYARYEQKENAKLIKQYNQIKNQIRLEKEAIREYGQYSSKATVSYKEVGLGKEQLKNTIAEYADIRGISKKEAMRIIKERGIYESTLSIEGTDIPSLERAAKMLKTGKATVGSGMDLYEVKRFGITDVTREIDKATEIGFEFNLRGSKLSKVNLKVTPVSDKQGITSIFEKVRASKYSPETNMILKEIILTKATQSGDTVIRMTKLGNIVESEYTTFGKTLTSYPYGKDKMTIKEAINLGLDQRRELARFGELFSRAGGKTSEFLVSKTEAPAITDFGMFKASKEGEYLFKQTGVGKRNIGLKNYVDKLAKEGIYEQMESLTRKPSKPIYETSYDFGQQQLLLQKSMQDSSPKQIIRAMISPTTTSFEVSTKTILKEPTLVKEILGETSLQVLGVSQLPRYEQSQILMPRLKSILQERTNIIEQEVFKEELSEKQIQRQGQRQSQELAQILENPAILQPEPTFTTPTFTPEKTLKAAQIEAMIWGIGSEKIKKRLSKKKRKYVELGLLPDFTSRMIGLEAQEYSLGNFGKAMKKIQTGFEIRRGGKIKGYNTDKSVLKAALRSM